MATKLIHKHMLRIISTIFCIAINFCFIKNNCHANTQNAIVADTMSSADSNTGVIKNQALNKEKMLKPYFLVSPMPGAREEIWDKNEEYHDFKEFKGSITIAYFWATWCISCKEELINLNVLAKELLYYDVGDITLLPISIDFKPIQHLIDFYAKNQLNSLKIYKDHKRKLMEELGITSLPTTIIFGPDGKQIARINKPMAWNDKRMYEEILALKKELIGEVAEGASSVLQPSAGSEKGNENLE